ncbi:formate dehydrogenase subunit alpha [Heliophilum fasciatum]|uniref:NAD-dependent formate dehydrogenase catalytic subunit n=1 Tax=Heliophilum fasciatum TaxID=35700 RepID=A0A4R2S911_9FIRM|nr:formate dehydrogenase subunit alpha [Heliophilum fasciatum]MCW2276718.1 formate dehydrogenase alpha subunit [Heliophilum fasciatum]TCP68901.1 NAD-dependent formate dehydrogenase catalytic subunit [Heliophilum fasciatum]
MEQVTLTIDGQAVTVAAGTTVLAAARSLGIHVPTLCHDPDLTSEGSCRLCVVHVAGARTLMPACVTAVMPGMVVQTAAPEVVEARRTIIELLLANHPNDCLTCERAGTCALQEAAYAYGVRFPEAGSPLAGEKHQWPPDESNPMLLRDMNKCILCGKCVRACAEWQQRHVLDFGFRGFATKIVADMDQDLIGSSCVYCGACLTVCPTGALLDRRSIGRGRPWEREHVRTTCGYCGTGCQFDLAVAPGQQGKRQVVEVVPTAEAPVNGRSLCVKGRFGTGFIHHRDRLRQPLIKKDGQWVAASWSEAIALIADRWQAIKADYGSDAFGVLASARATNEDNYVIHRLARSVFGTNNIDHCARLCHASSVTGLVASLGSGAMTNPIADLAVTDFFLVIGSNTTESHPVLALAMQKALKRGAQAAVIDPRRIELAGQAQWHLQLRPGTDLALLNAMAQVIIAEGKVNADFVAKRTENYEAVAEAVKDCTPEWAEAITGVPAAIIREVALAYATAPAGAIYYTMGVTQKTTGTHNVMAIANLALLTGQIGRPGTGVNPLRGQNNVQGACDMGALPNVYPGYQPVTDEAVRRKMAQAWHVPPESLSLQTGLTLGEMLDAVDAGTIKTLLIMGENPVVSDPDSDHVVQTLQKADFVVAIDLFMNETTELAHVVLPACSFAEKTGTFTNTERRVQMVRQAIEPIGEARPDWQIITELAAAMGQPFGYTDVAQIMKEIAEVTPSYGGISHERLAVTPQGLCWPCPAPDHPGTPRLHEQAFTRGLGRFHGVSYLPPAEQPDDDYPLILSTGRRLFHYHTGTMTRRDPGLAALYSEEHLEMHPDDAQALGIGDGDWVQVTSRRGSMELALRITDAIVPGTVFTSFHFAEALVNRLTNPARDTLAQIPELKVCAVAVQKIAAPEGYQRPVHKRVLV